MAHRIPNDAARVNVHNDQELEYWCRELGSSADDLREAVSAVGVEVDDVRQHLGQRSA
ncbi:DUF3606 domain-containing protein [Lysobacter xanthus]